MAIVGLSTLDLSSTRVAPEAVGVGAIVAHILYLSLVLSQGSTRSLVVAPLRFLMWATPLLSLVRWLLSLVVVALGFAWTLFKGRPPLGAALLLCVNAVLASVAYAGERCVLLLRWRCPQMPLKPLS